MKRSILTGFLLFSIIACKAKDNEFTFDKGYYTEYAISTSGKITDPNFASKVIIYYPANYDVQDTTVKYPIIYFLHPFGGDYTYYRSVYDVGTIMSYLVAKGEINPAILVFVNGKNPFGGSFYVNSVDIANNINVYGKYQDYIIEEVIPQVENSIISKSKLNGQRYIAGYSMGGYGSVWLSIARYDLFNKVASISGPLGFAIFTDAQAQQAVLQVLKSENSDFGNRLPLTFDSLASTLGVGKTFTTFIVALSAAFSPKFDNCANFLHPDSIKYTYITAQIGSNCAGFRLPVYKDLNSVNSSVLSNIWLLKDPLLFFGIAPDADSIIEKGIKYYISTGNGDPLEQVIYKMDSIIVDVMKGRYQSKGKNPNEYISYKVLDGSTDPFKFPTTHNQYVYNEIAEVLKFFLKK
ncbi:MAG: alpha/beta hydrolase-fold protein [candidate division WOR-3 bacterium]